MTTDKHALIQAITHEIRMARCNIREIPAILEKHLPDCAECSTPVAYASGYAPERMVVVTRRDKP